jgi:hypothetical protein
MSLRLLALTAVSIINNLLKEVAPFSCIVLVLFASPYSLYAEDNPDFGESDAELAMDLNNPVADLMSIPFQFNYAQNLGKDDDGERYLLNIQPVIPFDLNNDWNLISRTIVPLIRVEDVIPGESSKNALGDIVQSVFFSPKAPTEGGWIWGVGPAFLIPTATEDELGTEKWAAGPTAVVLTQSDGWTYGVLANHLWDYAGEDDRSDINLTFLQPFLVYTWPNAVSLSLNTETQIDWENEEESVPLNLILSRVTQLGGETLSFGAGITYWADSPDNGPEGLGGRFTITWLIPKS